MSLAKLIRTNALDAIFRTYMSTKKKKNTQFTKCRKMVAIEGQKASGSIQKKTKASTITKLQEIYWQSRKEHNTQNNNK
jgi:hypothetical protein